MTIADSRFDRPVSLRDAYRIMERFISAHHSRGEVPTGELLTAYLALCDDGVAVDPAALPDFLQAADDVIGTGRSPA